MLSGSDIYGRLNSADCSNVPIAETKTECHKLKDDELIEHLTLVPETGSHSDSLVIVTAVVELMIVNELQHQSHCSRERRKDKWITSLSVDYFESNCTYN
jgi:hypothetical protein